MRRDAAVGPATAVPAGLTALIGRRTEVTKVRRMLSVPRLVTLTVVGGVVKSRLALQVAGTAARQFPDGVHVAELASLRDPELLKQSVAAALGLVNASGLDMRDVVVDHVRGRGLLLLLDNCEHLVDACTPAVDALLRAAPDLRVLTAARCRASPVSRCFRPRRCPPRWPGRGIPRGIQCGICRATRRSPSSSRARPACRRRSGSSRSARSQGSFAYPSGPPCSLLSYASSVTYDLSWGEEVDAPTM
ncbi:hypothetical protein [Streptomyces acidicola]|uniref:hypothetical protein n=1 Tax=Streptomyces acidicola TaxID=2596892 RepID=UPI00380E8E05